MPSDPEDESMDPGVKSELGLEYGGRAGLQLDDSRDLDGVGHEAARARELEQRTERLTPGPTMPSFPIPMEPHFSKTIRN